MNDSKIENPLEVAKCWVSWCGETAWSRALIELSALGGRIRWQCGYPQSASAIPLCFELFDDINDDPLPGHSRLKDIRAACMYMRGKQQNELLRNP